MTSVMQYKHSLPSYTDMMKQKEHKDESKFSTLPVILPMELLGEPKQDIHIVREVVYIVVVADDTFGCIKYIDDRGGPLGKDRCMYPIHVGASKFIMCNNRRDVV